MSERRVPIGICLGITMALGVSAVQAAEPLRLGDRYEGYRFEPTYSEASAVESAKASLQPSLVYKGETYWGVDVAQAVAVSGKVFSAYEVNAKRDFVAKLAKDRRMARWYDDIEPPPPDRWQAISLITQEGEVKELLRDSVLFASFHYGWDFYGCVEREKVFKAQLFEGRPTAVFAVTSIGDNTSKAVADNIVLHVINNEKIQADIFLFNSNYYAANFEDGEIRPPFYYNRAGGGSDVYPWLNVRDDMAGRKIYGKMFVRDFDRNDRLDLLVWKREYKSRKVNDSHGPGFEFDREWFEHYEENATSDGLTHTELSADSAKAWLEEADLHWRGGFPSANRCEGERAKLPMMMHISDPAIR